MCSLHPSLDQCTFYRYYLKLLNAKQKGTRISCHTKESNLGSIMRQATLTVSIFRAPNTEVFVTKGFPISGF